ncbi:MAG TPA: FG-GAP-like repeat-containing protein [Ignavibacteria bacterium]
MRKYIYYFLFFFIPYLLHSQYKIENNFQVSFQVTPSIVKRTDSIGVYIAKGGFDINKNGKKEMLLLTDPTISGGSTSDSSNTLLLLENDGNDNYKLIWSYKFPYSVRLASYHGYGDITVADVDNDGNMEIWAALPILVSDYDPNPPRIFCFEYDGTKLPSEPTVSWNLGLRDKMLFRPSSLVIEDVDGDSDPEIIVVSRRDDYTGTDKGRTLIVATAATPIEQNGLNVILQEYIDTSAYLKGGGLFDMKVTDFDGDGKKEIWAFTWDKLTINIFESTGNNQYAHVAEIRQAINIPYNQSMGDIGSLYGATFYDANKDGKLECYIAGCAGENAGEDGAIILVKNVDDVSKLDKAKVSNDWSNYIKVIGYRYTGGNPRGASVGDLDNDGLMDFVFVDRKNDKVIRMEYKGSGNLEDSTSYNWSELFVNTDQVYLPDYMNAMISKTDMDGDGYPEVILSNLDVKDPSKPMTIVIEYSGKPNDVEKKFDLNPITYNLAQNYPNPFNPKTQIEFEIPKTSFVNLRVFDLLGQEVTTLVNKQKNPGKYTVTFNGDHLASGIYYYTLRCDNFIATKKMLMLK